MLTAGLAQAQRVKGSDTLLPLTQELAEEYLEEHPEGEVIVTGGGSGVGIAALMENTTDIAMASRRIKFGEKMKFAEAGLEAREVIVAYDALAVVVNPSNPVTQLTREQLEGIFRGKITNWKEVGGEDCKIVVYSRETSSGTYEFFKESVLYARDRSHHPVGQADQGGHRLYRTGLSQQVCEASGGVLRRRRALCGALCGDSGRRLLSYSPSAVLLL